MRDLRVSTLISLFIITLACLGEAAAQAGGNWPQWRGPNRDGISKETGLLKQWPDGGPPLAWKATGAGNGDLSALDTATGKVVWSMNVLEKFGGEQITWGISESPLIVGDRLLVNPGGPGASIVALNKKDGALIWKSQSERAGYSSAIALEAAGTPQVVFFTSTRAVGLDLKDGRLLWEYGKPSNRTANAATPSARNN